jgi:hypothetical protein
MQLSVNFTRRDVVLCIAASGFIVGVSHVATRSAAAQLFPKRKNIDSLTAAELDNYKHAMDILQQRSRADPTRQDGYVYQAGLHNKIRRHPDWKSSRSLASGSLAIVSWYLIERGFWIHRHPSRGNNALWLYFAFP